MYLGCYAMSYYKKSGLTCGSNRPHRNTLFNNRYYEVHITNLLQNVCSQIGRKIQCESYRSGDEVTTRLSFAVRIMLP